MKRLLSYLTLLSLLAGLFPTAHASGSIEDWEAIALQCEELRLLVDWYPQYQGIIRRYGYDRMLMVQNGQSYLRTVENRWNRGGPFDAVDEFDENGHALAAQNGKWGKIDHNGGILVDFLYDTREEVRLADGERGQAEIPPSGNGSPDDFHEGLRWVNAQGTTEGTGAEANGPWGFADESGRVVVPPIFDAVGYFDYGVATVKVGDVYGLLQNPLKVEAIIQEFEQLTGGEFDVTWFARRTTIGPVQENQLIYEQKIVGGGPKSTSPKFYDYGLLDLSGRRIIPTVYGTTKMGGVFGDEGFRIRVAGKYSDDGKAVYTDILGNEFTLSDIVPLTDSVSVVWDWDLEKPYYYGNYWTKEQLIPGYFDHAYTFSEGIGIVSNDGMTYAIDRAGDTLFTLDDNLHPDYYGEFHEGLCSVRDNTTYKYGAIDKTGQLVIPCIWSDLRYFNEGLARVCNDEGMYGYIDREGTLVIPCILDAASDPNVLMGIVYKGVQGIWRNPNRKDMVSDWARAEVSRAEELGLVTESCAYYQTFSITREQFAELAVNFLEKATEQIIQPASQDTFTDTAEEATLKAYAAGIVQGMGDGLFGPGRPLTREQLAAMLWRTLEQAGLEECPADLGAYADGGTVSSWATDALANLAGHGIMAGTGGNMLSPKTPCTVEQALLLLVRATDQTEV